MRGRERGQVLPLVTVVVLVVGVACLAVGKRGGRAVEEARAAAAADAAALAAAAGPAAGEELAEANGTRLAGLETAGADTRASVEAPGGATATARARRAGR
ncbi:MAG: hypothetical protein ACLGIO_15255, partial [Acidimicrobiia bacterium]